jgi:hypothetical protein
MSFPLFSYLPIELRFEIWRLSCQPRVVEVEYDTMADRVRTPTRPPAVLHVHRESRAEALGRWYELAFSSNGYYVPFSPALDVLYVPRPRNGMGYNDGARDLGTRFPASAARVSRLAIDHVRPDLIRPWEPYNKLCLLQSFASVTHAYLVFGLEQEGGRGEGSGEIELIDPRGDVSSIMRLIDGVVQSFCHEAGPVVCGLGACDEAWPMPAVPHLEPKSKVIRSWTESEIAVHCM